MFKSVKAKIIARWAFNTKNWIPTTKEYDQLLSLVQTNEQEKIKKIKVLENLKSSLIGRLLMILLFNRIYGIGYREVEFDRTEYNKPILINPKLNILCDFNISHHGDWVVLVAGENCRIGIDLMKIEQPNAGYNVKKFITTFKDQFTENEFNLLINNQQQHYNKEEVEIRQLQRFYRFWCLKESYVKAVGIGLYLALNSFEFRLDENEENLKIKKNTKLYVNNELKVEWGFEEHCLDEEHCVCIAYDTNHNSNNGDDRKETVNEGFEIIEIQEIFNLTGTKNNRVEATYACDASPCKVPDCFCVSQNPPVGLALDKTPQFVLLTFDDSIQDRSVKDNILHPQKEVIGCKKASNAFAGIPNGKISVFRTPFLDWTPKDEKSIPHLMDPMLDGTPDQVMTRLKDNFNRHTKRGSIPFGVYLHPVQLSEIPEDQALNHLSKCLKNFSIGINSTKCLPFKCQTPNVGKAICNGLDDDKNGQVDEGLKESCNFDIAVWSHIYADQSKLPNDVNSNASSNNNTAATTPSATPSNNSTSDSTIIIANTKNFFMSYLELI
ncbi:2155_t:CDS:10 [Entrophospora sp. SA101]|nr:2155_t:CDS:10 [Entrophospora sp. SA101]